MRTFITTELLRTLHYWSSRDVLCRVASHEGVLNEFPTYTDMTIKELMPYIYSDLLGYRWDADAHMYEIHFQYWYGHSTVNFTNVFKMESMRY